MTQRNIHGGHEFHFEKNLLIGRSWGAWNDEAIILYGNLWKAEVGKKGFKYWGYCVDVREWELATPSAIDLIFTLTDWCNKHGGIFSGNIVSNIVTDHVITDEHNKREYEHENRTFTNEQECLKWCRAKAEHWNQYNIVP
ncbi:hypothetical protein L4C34_05805 [Vibrio profundum]|uniref:hypothetical protein n=1 Tax=Vibrio profundum TaxID=2910247 RepID=UPI003D0F30A2